METYVALSHLVDPVAVSYLFYSSMSQKVLLFYYNYFIIPIITISCLDEVISLEGYVAQHCGSAQDRSQTDVGLD